MQSLFAILKINKKKRKLCRPTCLQLCYFLKRTPIDSINESIDLKKTNLLVIAPASQLSGAHKLE